MTVSSTVLVADAKRGGSQVATLPFREYNSLKFRFNN
uniref:Uncharacterized protein n=1 Tax=Setaria italica TaxID=4555 RepID=K3YNP0_SETIT